MMEVYNLKKLLGICTLAILLFLGGCSFLEEVNNTVTYMDEATEYVNEVTVFVDEVPNLAEQAINDEQALADLKMKLEDMKTEIDAFNELQAPEMAADLHQQIMDQNNKAKDGIETLLNTVENGKLNPDMLKNSEMYQTFQEISDTIDQIKQLGQ